MHLVRLRMILRSGREEVVTIQSEAEGPLEDAVVRFLGEARGKEFYTGTDAKSGKVFVLRLANVDFCEATLLAE